MNKGNAFLSARNVVRFLSKEWNPDIYVHSMNAEKLEKENSESLSEFG